MTNKNTENLQETLALLKELSGLNKKTVQEIMIKLSEESGELAQALLSYLNVNGSEYKELGLDDVKEEAIDVIIVALSLFYKVGGSDKELKTTLNSKINKWQEKSGLTPYEA